MKTMTLIFFVIGVIWSAYRLIKMRKERFPTMWSIVVPIVILVLALFFAVKLAINM